MKNKSRKSLTKKLDELVKQITRLRDGFTCQVCDKHIEGCNAHTCHVVAKGNGASWRRFDLLNVFVGCMKCHDWWHKQPLESGKWFAKRFRARDKYLEKYKYGKSAKISTDEMINLIDQYKQKFEELKNGV